VKLNFIVNGKAVSVDTDPSSRLLDVLRNTLNMTSPKEGCGEGECGACAVLIDGKLINSCLAIAAMAEGKSIVTLEGYRTSPRFEALKKGFEKAGSIQCGFCTPGFILAAEALLSVNPHPSESEVRVAIEGNLCRCTGYTMIVNGILEASKGGDGLW
jgi:carbon-monoxide dehydrogenase small subunit